MGNSNYANVFLACKEVGIELRVTTGVIHEVNSHMNRAMKCSITKPVAWHGAIPYLYYKYLEAGKSPDDFRKWISLYRGNERPGDDLVQFLSETFGMKRQDLNTEVEKSDSRIRFAAVIDSGGRRIPGDVEIQTSWMNLL